MIHFGAQLGLKNIQLNETEVFPELYMWSPCAGSITGCHSWSDDLEEVPVPGPLVPARNLEDRDDAEVSPAPRRLTEVCVPCRVQRLQAQKLPASSMSKHTFSAS